MGQNIHSLWYVAVMQVFSILIIIIIFFFALFISEGPPTICRTADSITIGYRKSVNSRVMDIQITDFGDFIHKIEPDYDNEYFYFDTRLRTYWRHLL